MHILLIDAFPDRMLTALRALPGARVSYHPDIDRPGVLALLPHTDALVLNSKVNVDAELLAQAPRLRIACRAGVGLDHFDLEACARHGLRVMSTPGANAIPVAEQAVGMLLALLHRIIPAHLQVRRFEWKREENRGTELFGKTVGIIGYGNTGTAVGRCLRGFGCRILAYDKYKTGFGSDAVQESTLETLMAEADILSLHVPLTDETLGWVDAAFLHRFRKPIRLLNLARGPIVPLAGLIEALDSGQVIAAALDVLENEKMDRLSPAETARLENLFARENVIFTPHIGGWSHESLDRINDWIVRDLAALAQEMQRP